MLIFLFNGLSDRLFAVIYWAHFDIFVNEVLFHKLLIMFSDRQYNKMDL